MILDTARHLLVRDGYKNLSMRRIAREIGYSATSIYLHFENKDALFHALIEEGMERLYRVYCSVTEGGPADPVQRFVALCRAYIQFGLENPEYYEIMFMAHPEHMARYPADKYRRARRNLDVIAAVLEEGHRQGVLEATQPRVAASVVWSSLHGAIALLIAKRVDVRIDAQEFIEAAIAQTLRGFLSRHAREETVEQEVDSNEYWKRFLKP
jgi:AcrR family transcriptional regulator